MKKILKEGELIPKQIGIVTPYSGQVKHLTDLFEREGGLSKGDKFYKMSINSVDGFQGREKDLILFSAVRANSEVSHSSLTRR